MLFVYFEMSMKHKCPMIWDQKQAGKSMLKTY